MPSTAKGLGVNPYYINENIIGGIKYLKSLQDKFGSVDLVIAAYNAGPGAVKRHNGIPPYRETRAYVKKIVTHYNYLKVNPDPVILKVQKEIKQKESSKQLASANNQEQTQEKILPAEIEAIKEVEKYKSIMESKSPLSKRLKRSKIIQNI